MNQYVTGAVIKELREKNHITQLQLAEELEVSDKTISKWETVKGIADKESGYDDAEERRELEKTAKMLFG